MDNYLYGRPENIRSYDDLMAVLAAHESLKSYQTSTLPLAQFWYPDNNLEKRVSQLFDGLSIDWHSAYKCFEYATSLPNGDFGRGKASMTDLMVIDKGRFRVAIEAKYTEYKKLSYDKPVEKWLAENRENRELVLRGWERYLNNRATIQRDTPYQLVHRIASACAGADDEIPVVIYHLFGDSALEVKMNKFVDNIKKWVSDIGLNGVEFRIVKTRVEPSNTIKTIPKKALSEIFLKMKECPYGCMDQTELVWRLDGAS